MGSSIALIHRILGESLITVTVVGALLSLFATGRESRTRRVALVVLRVFGALISVQWLLGLVNYFTHAPAARPSLAHPLLMTLFVALFHVLQAKARKGDGFSRWGLVGLYAGSWLFIFLGIRAM